MEFTPEMIMKLNIAEKNLLAELYRKCLGTTMEERVQEHNRNQWKWTTPGPALSNPKVLLNPLAKAGIIKEEGHSTVGLTSLEGRA